MHKFIVWTLAVCVSWMGTGCANNRPRTAAEGQAIFASLQKAAAAASKKVAPSLALIKIEKEESDGKAQNSKQFLLNGILLTAKGFVLVPAIIKPDDDNRITVLIGEDEYRARPIKTDDTLSMTILKIDSDETFVPLDFTKSADLSVGEWAVVLNPTDENADYQKLSTLVVCQGEMAGRVRRFLLNQSFANCPGALVVNLSGQIVGLTEMNSALAANDLQDDIKNLIADASANSLPDDDKNKKGWFGAMLEPVNKDLAKAKKLSPSSVWCIHAVKDAPAATAGLRDGDLIVGLNGKPLRFSGNRSLEYFRKSLHPRVGAKFALTVLRNNKTLELQGTFSKPPEPETLRAEDLGVTLSGITDNEFFGYNLSTNQGVLVTEVHRGSPAATSGTLRQTLISKGDIITELDGQPTPTIEAFSKVLETIRHDRPPVVLVKYSRGLMTGYAGLNLAIGEKDNGDKQ